MQILEFFKKILFGPRENDKPQTPTTIYEQTPQIEEIHSLWDYIKLIENTQAAHILSVLGFEEWVTMEEILRRIKEIFGVDYQNKRSLYPYIKTLVDVGLLETSNIGDKKKWRKKDTLIKFKGKKDEKEDQKQGQKQETVATQNTTQ